MLSQDVERYIALQRTLGFKFFEQSYSLKSFADYAMAHGDDFVRLERVLAWAAQTTSVQCRHTLVGRVRRFALAMQAENPRHEIPPKDCVGHAKVARRQPYIYTADEIDSIMRAARQMPPSGFIGPETLTTLIGLLASTGLRISEVLSLLCSDVGDDGLIIRKSKNGKSRLIPLHETTLSALGRHLSGRAHRAVYTQALFVSKKGQALKYATVLAKFRQILASTGLRPTSASGGPRIHDLRHTFAVRSLEQCKHGRPAVAQHTIALSTYLGHTNLRDTYWYLEATPIIMNGIAKAGEAMHQGGDA